MILSTGKRGSGWIFMAATLLFWAGCRKPGPVRFVGLNGISLQAKSLSQTVVNAQIAVFNPNRMDLYVSAVDAVISLNEVEVSQYHLDSSIRLPASDTFYFPVKMHIANSALLSGGLRSLMDGKAAYRISGTMRAGTKGFRMTIPIDERGNAQF